MRRGHAPKFALAASALVILGNSGCDPELAQRCRLEFAELQTRFAEARQRFPVEAERGLASVSGAETPAWEPEECTHWARKRLDQVQHMLDTAMREPGLRDAAVILNQMATDLVMLHGSCERSDHRRLRRQLAALEPDLEKARQKACP